MAQAQQSETVDSLAGKIKAKYPAYNDMDNHELVQKVVNKYPQYQNLLSTESLQQAAAASAPQTTGVLGTLGEAAQGLKGLVSGAFSSLVPMVTDEYGMPNPAVAEPTAAMAASPAKSILGKVALSQIPGASGVVSAADLAKRYAFGGAPAENLGISGLGKPLLNETIPQAQSNIAQTAGALAGAALIPKISASASDLISEGARKAAPGIAESATGVRWTDRLHGKQPGEALLGETTGVKPEDFYRSGVDRLHRIGKTIWDNYHNVGETRGAASLKPTLDVLDDFRSRAKAAERDDLVNAIDAEKERVTRGGVSVNPGKLWSLKWGVGEAPGWEKLAPDVKTQIRQAEYGAMDRELDRVVPENKDLNDRYSSLATAVNRAHSTELQAGVAQRVMNRMGAPTGALSSALFGAYEGGPLGAVAGLVGPELGRLPSVQMRIARGLWNIGGGEPRPEPSVSVMPWERRLGLEAPPTWAQRIGTPVQDMAARLGGIKMLPPVPSEGQVTMAGPGQEPITTDWRGLPSATAFKEMLISRGQLSPRMLPEVAGGPFEMPPSSTIETFPPAERRSGKYAGMLDQSVKRVGPREAEPDLTPRRPIKIKGRRGYLPIIRETPEK